MRIQTELLDLLRDLPVCVGLGVKGDVHKIKQFYTEVSGINLECLELLIQALWL